MLLLNSVGTAATSHLGTMHYLPTIRFIVWLRHMGHIAVLLVVVSYDRLTSPEQTNKKKDNTPVHETGS